MVAALSRRRIDAIGWLWVAGRLTAMVAALALALVLHGLWRAVRAPSPWPRLLLGGVARIAGARAVVHGGPLRRDALLLANHTSWLDILLLAGASGTAFVAKAELARVPLIGWLCRLNNTVFVARADRLGVADQIAQVRGALSAGQALAIFPEGTTEGAGTLLPFKAPLLAVLTPPPPGIRVQPVRLDYGPALAAVAWTGQETGRDNALRILARPGGFDVALHFLPPLDPAALGNRKAIAQAARDSILASAGNRPA